MKRGLNLSFAGGIGGTEGPKSFVHLHIGIWERPPKYNFKYSRQEQEEAGPRLKFWGRPRGDWRRHWGAGRQAAAGRPTATKLRGNPLLSGNLFFFLKKSHLWRLSIFSSKQLLFDPAENLPMVTEGSGSGGMRWPWHLGWPVCQCRDRLPWLCREIITSWQRTQLLSFIMAMPSLHYRSKQHLTFNTRQMTWVWIMKLLETMFFFP